MTAPASTCAAPGCSLRSARGRLCTEHHAKLRQSLTDLSLDLTGDLAPPLGGWRTDPGGGGRLASERAPINLTLLAAQAQAPAYLAAWAAWVVSADPRIRRTGDDVGLLTVHLDWICEQPEIVDFWCQIRGVWSQIRGRAPVRRCTCGGPVWFERGGGWCSWCATGWSGRALLELRPAEEAA